MRCFAIPRWLVYLLIVQVLVPRPVAAASRDWSRTQVARHAAQQYFEVALAVLADVVRDSMLDGDLVLSRAERDALAMVARDAKLEALVFRTAQDDFFVIDGEVRVARTGDHPGDPIYINNDLIVTERIPGYPQPISLANAQAVVIHEALHHVASARGWPHEAFDALAGRLSQYHQPKDYRYTIYDHLSPGLGYLKPQFIAIGFGNYWGYSRLFWLADGPVQELTAALEGRMDCGDRFALRGKTHQLLFKSFRLRHVRRHRRGINLLLSGSASSYCVVAGRAPIAEVDYDYQLNWFLTERASDRVLVVVPEKSQFWRAQ